MGVNEGGLSGESVPGSRNLQHKRNIDFLSSRDWLESEVTGQEVVLAFGAALEALELFSGYSYEYEIDVYAIEKGESDNITYHIIKSFDEIDCVIVGGLMCTSPSQTVNDMLDNFEWSDEQALLEALNCYYHENGKSFDSLRIEQRNMELFDQVKDWALDYYSGGWDD